MCVMSGPDEAMLVPCARGVRQTGATVSTAEAAVAATVVEVVAVVVVVAAAAVWMHASVLVCVHRHVVVHMVAPAQVVSYTRPIFQ